MTVTNEMCLAGVGQRNEVGNEWQVWGQDGMSEWVEAQATSGRTPQNASERHVGDAVTSKPLPNPPKCLPKRSLDKCQLLIGQSKIV